MEVVACPDHMLSLYKLHGVHLSIETDLNMQSAYFSVNLERVCKQIFNKGHF